MVSPITDPDLIKRLEANSSNQPITDPDMIAKLEASSTGASQKPTTGNLYDIARDALAGVLTGLGRGGEFIAKTATGGYAPDLPQDLINKVGSSNPSVVGKIAKGVGEYAPYAIAGGAGLLPEISTEGTSAYKVGNLLKNLAANPGQIASGALSGAATNPDDRVQGALESAIMNALTGGAANVLEALRPTNLLRGTLTPEQLQKNVDVTAGTETPLGDVIDSPRLKRLFENVLPYLPFSGAPQAAQRVASDIKSQGKNIFSQLGVDKLGPNSGSQLKDALKSASSDARVEKQKNYNVVNKMADDAGLVVGRENFSNKAKEILDEIDQSPELKRKFPSGLLADIQSYADNKEGNTLKLSNIFRSTLGDDANDLYTKGQTYQYGLVKSLQDALSGDIDSSIEKFGTPEIKSKYAEAQKNYQEKFAPFEDPDIVKFTRRGGDPDLILSHFIKTGQNDRATLLQKLISKMSPTSKTLPLQMYLAKSLDNGEVNPLTFKTLYDKLGDNQKKVLINDDKTRDMLENYSDLIKKNTSPLTIMANPKTGQQGLDAQNATLLALLGHMASGNIGALGLAGGAIAGGKLGTKALTSEAVRKALVKKMINNKPLFTGGGKVSGYQTAQQALVKALGGDNNQ